METLNIGSGGDAGGQFQFTGKIDDVALFATALSGPAINIIKVRGVTGFLEHTIEATVDDFDPTIGDLTLRWPNIQPPYEVISSPDLSFGPASTVIPVDATHGSIDTTTFPGEVRVQFVDPGAMELARFWLVREVSSE